MRAFPTAAALAVLLILSLSKGGAAIADTTGPAGGGQPQSTVQPSIALGYYIQTNGPAGSFDRIGDIVMTAANFAPAGNFLPADGRLLSIFNYQLLFAHIGTQYGGDGQTTFALPDLRGRVPIGAGGSYAIGQTAGVESVTLTTANLPSHSHTLPDGGATSSTGGGQPYTNMQPSLALQFNMPMQGTYPSRDGQNPDQGDVLGFVEISAGNYLIPESPPGVPVELHAQGQILPISSNIFVFSLLGTTYGGDGKSNFALPDMRDRAAIGTGQGPGLGAQTLGQVDGAATVSLDPTNMPAHTHTAQGGNTGSAGGGQPVVTNMQETLALNYLIADGGIYPSGGTNDGQTFFGQVALFAGSFAPSGWLFADGSLLAIAEHDTLFSLLGTTYGGDGQETFALPDLRGRLVVGADSGPRLLDDLLLGETLGTEFNTLTNAQMPTHTHEFTPQLVAAPEPLSFALFGLGLAGLGAVTRRRRRA